MWNLLGIHPETPHRNSSSLTQSFGSRTQTAAGGYSRGSSSLMEAILKNQLRHVSFAVSFTSSTVKESERERKNLRGRDSLTLPTEALDFI